MPLSHQRFVIPCTLVAAGVLFLASPLYGATIPWNGSLNDHWQSLRNWDTVIVNPPFFIHRVPGDLDTALLSTPVNDIVRLYDHTAPINGLNVSNGIDIETNGFLLQVDDTGAAHTILSGSGTRLRVTARTDDPANTGFATDDLSIDDYASLRIEGGVASVAGQATIRGNGWVEVISGGAMTMFNLRLASIVAGGHGSILVDGSNSVLNITGTGAQSIGVGDSGYLTVRDRGSLTTGTGTITIGPFGQIELKTISFGGGSMITRGNILVSGGNLIKSAESVFLMAANSMLTAESGGQVRLEGDYPINNGRSFLLTSDADLTVNGDLSVGDGSGGALIIDGAGTTISVGGPLYIGLNGGIGSLTVQNGATPFLGAVHLAFNGAANTRALMRLQSGAGADVFNFDISGRGDGSDATVIITGTGSRIMQAVNATLLVGTQTSFGSATLDVLLGGDFTHAGGAGTFSIYTTGTVNIEHASFHSGGDVNVAGGTLHVFEGGTVVLSNGAAISNNGGTITGRGTILLGAGILQNAGNVAPGDTVGDLTLSGGHYLQTQDGTLTIELPAGGIAGQDYNRLFVSGTASLDGTLQVVLTNGFVPALNDSFEVLRANGGVLGTFTTEQLPTLSPCLGWDVGYGPNGVTLQVIAQGVPGDLDGDNDMDLDDYAIFFGCLAGPDVASPPLGCSQVDFEACDFDVDQDVDEADFGFFQAFFGASTP